jgi:hypothetical protein
MSFTQIPVFVNNSWLHVDVPNHIFGPMRFVYATSWVAARNKDLSEHDSKIVAEAIVYQRLYPGIVHNSIVHELMKKVS